MPDPAPIAAFGRSLSDFGHLSSAEKLLLECCRVGRVAEIGSAVPDEANDANRVRAGFVRFLALGGDAATPVHEHGVHLMGAWIEDAVDLEAATIASPLRLHRCRIERFDAPRARFRLLSLIGSHLTGNFDGTDLICESSLFLRKDFRCDGETTLKDARIHGALECGDAVFNNPGGNALSADRAKIVGAVFLLRSEVNGTLRFGGAEIGDDLDCRSVRISNPDDLALFGDGAKIGSSLLLREGARIVGNVFFVGATIASDVECGGGTFEEGDGAALAFERANISGSVILNEGFDATGRVSFNGARIGGDLFCQQAKFENGHEHGLALSLAGARIEGTLDLREARIPAGIFDLSGARVGGLCDQAETWSTARGRYVLDGFTYARIGGSAPVDDRSRIAWLRGQSVAQLEREFRPQPWEQLISVLRSMGHPNAARAVAIAKQKQLRKAGGIPLGALPFHWLYGLLVGYGFKIPRLVLVMTGVWALCGGAYWIAAHPGAVGLDAPLIAPKTKDPSAACLAARASTSGVDPCPPAPPDYASFVPAVYSLDVLLPVINLGYRNEWQPVVRDAKGRWLPWGFALRFLYWFEIGFGWIGGLLLVGVLGNLIKKD